MSWETRSNGKRYYTRSSRVNGRIRREYVGGGQLAEFVAKLDELDRESRLLEAELILQARQQAARIEESLVDFEILADSVGRGLLIAAGYHQHNRGEWRKRNE